MHAKVHERERERHVAPKRERATHESERERESTRRRRGAGCAPYIRHTKDLEGARESSDKLSLGSTVYINNML